MLVEERRSAPAIWPALEFAPPWRKPPVQLIDVATLPDLYAMQCIGRCMEPEVAHGSTLVFDKFAPCRPGDIVVVIRSAEAVVAAYDHWKEATKALEISTGATAADAHWGRLYKRQSRLVTKAIAIPAQSMAGLKAKASIASLWFNDQGDIAGPSRGEEFALAIITDLQNMGGGHG
jgi:hypothetical protein